MLLGEDRNVESRTASFFCADPSGTLWKGKNFGEQWWTGIETVHHGVLFLYGFATPDLPGRKGITAVDCATGNLLWKNGDLTFIAANGGKIYSSQNAPGGPVVAEIDHRTGALVRELGRGTDVLLHVPRTADGPDDAEYPQVLSNDDISPLSDLIRKFSDPAIVESPVEYGEHGPYVVIVSHRREGSAGDARTSYARLMDVVERSSGNTVMHVSLDASLPAPAPDSFLMHADTLYFVRERKRLTAVELRTK
jgi:hypothetical protein